MTRDLCATLKAVGISLVGESPYLPMNVGTFDDVFRGHATDGWNGLLLVSHGAPPRKPGDAAVLRIGDLRTNWFLANAVPMNLNDKAVFLAICSGACEDAIWVLLREQLALTITGSNTSLSGREVREFFPAFLIDVDQASKAHGQITPEALRVAAERHAGRANNKIKVLSAVGFAKE
ncbi:uncharacterized protein SOCE26_051020 [Sorangium cellulosum]|uniref:Uncharacterized protein n=2 Tax=Sorangium cellulosum TaxID=56 RepID=A0A2L0EWH5_SORCE|nr:uncharacterized protein SOCE26_051020 [Sorangium cellulosum]